MQGGGDLADGNNGVNSGLLGLGLHGGSNSNGNGNGGNGLIGPAGTLGIVSGDYIDLNELLNMDGHCGGNDDEQSLVA
uniref:Uncharacterized protein n=1 Tax=Anopheles christyi TaxID=43041 RepID=A0A182K3Y8_9DIPT